MKEAHSSVDREQTIHEENQKLKQENAELRAKYEKETLENKIKTLEMQNEIQALKHEIEIAQFKSQQEKKDIENQMAKEIESLKHQIEVLKIQNHDQKSESGTSFSNQEPSKTESKKEQELEGAKNDASTDSKQPFRFLVEGAEKILVYYHTGEGDFYGENYKSWYEDMSNLMEHRRLYINKKFVLIRKNVKDDWATLYFGSLKRKDDGTNEDDDRLLVENLHEKLPEEANVFLLHPSDLGKIVKMEFDEYDNGIRWWETKEMVSEDFYFGDRYSVIMLAEFK